MNPVAWTLIVTLGFGTPHAKDIVAAENIPSWYDCLQAGVAYLRAKPGDGSVSVTCEPAKLKV